MHDVSDMFFVRASVYSLKGHVSLVICVCQWRILTHSVTSQVLNKILYIHLQIMKAVETLSIFVCIFLITWSAGDGAPQWRPQGRFGKRFSSSRTSDFMTALEGGPCKYIET